MAKKRSTRSTRSRAKPTKPATITLGSNFNLVFRMPDELSAKPAEVSRVLLRISARVRMWTEYVRVAHERDELGFLNYTMISQSSARRLWSDVTIGMNEKTWDDPFNTRRALEQSVAPHSEPWQIVEHNHELLYYAGEYDLEHPRNAMLRDAAFPEGSGLDAPNVIRPRHVKVYIRPDYPELNAWQYRWMMLDVKVSTWLHTSHSNPDPLPESVLRELEEFASWHERFADRIALLGDVINPRVPQISLEVVQQMRAPRLRRPIPTAKAATALNTRADLVLKRLRARGKTIVGPEGAFTAEFDDILDCYPEHRKKLNAWADKNYPEVAD